MIIRTFVTLAVFVAVCIPAFSQSNLQKLVDTENSFARTASEKGTKAAFLEFLADDAVVFNPNRSNGKQVWMARKASPSLLSWYPAFADISGNGLIGYTTGPWEFRPKGKGDAPVAFGHYVTLWQKQQSGDFKAVLDIGVSHDKSPNAEPAFNSASAVSIKNGETKSSASDTAVHFYELVSGQGISKAYKEFAADDIRLLRDGKLPIVGKKAALDELKKIKSGLTISKRTTFFGADDIAYTSNTYSLNADGKAVEPGNFMQIWKYRDKKWKIVLDIFVANPT